MSQFIFDEKVQAVIDKLSNDKSAGAINGSGLGAGKTSVTVQVALNRGAKRVLIIAPPNTFDGWFDHIKWIAGAELKYCGNQSLKFTHAPDVDNRLARKTLTVTKAQAQANLTGALGGDEGWFFVSRELFVKMDWQKQPEIRNGRPVLTKAGKPKFKNVRLNVWGRSKKSHWDLVGYDECFIEGTKISTPNGLVNIEDLRVGDEVYGYDHTNNQLIVTSVCNVMVKSSNNINLSLGATTNHPYFVDNVGYLPLGDLKESDYVVRKNPENNEVQRVRFGVYLNEKTSRTKVLHIGLRSKVHQSLKGAISSNIRVSSLWRRSKESDQINNSENLLPCLQERTDATEHGFRKANTILERELLLESRVASKKQGDIEKGSNTRVKGENLKKNEGNESCKEPRDSKEDSGNKEAEWGNLYSFNGWERDWDVIIGENSTGGIGGRLGVFSRGRNRSWSESEGFGEQLQDRYSKSQSTYWDRVRWKFSFSENGKRERQKERGVFEGQGVDYLEVLEPRNPRRYRKMLRKNTARSETKVYNIETGSNNYFADDILVHNCQSIANKDSHGNSSFRYSLSADYKLVMSADWFGNKLENMYGVATAIWGKLPYTFTYFKTRYFHTEYDPFTYDKVKISKKGELVAGAFVKTLPTYVALPSGVVQPEAIPVSVELTRTQRKLYSQLERTMATELESGDVLVTEIPLITRMRLRELALGEFDIAGYSIDDEGNKKPIIEFPVDAPSAKLDELLRLLKEYEGESFLVYTHSKKFANKTVQWLRNRGIKTDSITSDTTDKAKVKDGFLSRDFRVLVCTSAIAVGVDSLQFVCRNLVFLSEDENALNNGQVIGRIARRGQADVVNVWKLVARDTVDVQVYDNLILRAIANNRSKTLAQSGNIK